MPDTLDTRWQDMQQEAAHKLSPRDLHATFAAVCIRPHPERYLAVIEVHERGLRPNLVTY